MTVLCRCFQPILDHFVASNVTTISKAAPSSLAECNVSKHVAVQWPLLIADMAYQYNCLQQYSQNDCLMQ